MRVHRGRILSVDVRECLIGQCLFLRLSSLDAELSGVICLNNHSTILMQKQIFKISKQGFALEFDHWYANHCLCTQAKASADLNAKSAFS